MACFPSSSDSATVSGVSPRIYLETSVVSYLVGRLSRDVIVLGNQELTREWWASRRGEYELFISEVVIGEASIGDAELARQRLALAQNLPLLAVTEEAERLAPLLLRAAGLAPNAETDALHMQSLPCMEWTIYSLGTVSTSPTRPFDVLSKGSADCPGMNRR